MVIPCKVKKAKLVGKFNMKIMLLGSFGGKGFRRIYEGLGGEGHQKALKNTHFH